MLRRIGAALNAIENSVFGDLLGMIALFALLVAFLVITGATGGS